MTDIVPADRDLHGTGLTSAEAAERSRLIEVSEYRIEMDFTGTATDETFVSRTVIDFSCRRPGAGTWVDLIAADVHRVVLNGVELDPAEIKGAERLAIANLASENTLTVEAAHVAGTGHTLGRGISRSVDAEDGEVYVWSQFEAFDARRAYACFDQPDLKAAFSCTVRAPMRWTCVSNGRVEDVSIDGDANVWRFSRTPRLPTYVTAFCAGPFHVVEDADGDPVIRLHARRSLGAHLESAAPELIRLTRDGLAHFGEHFGTGFAGDSYDYAFLPDFGGAMENFGCVTWTDEVIHRSEPAPQDRRMREVILLHEMAHMWFGNLVTMRWWDGLWLNESFADWAAFWALSRLRDGTEAWSYFLLMRKYRGYLADQSPTTHPISGRVPDIEAAEASVDMITYAKGASVLRQLVAAAGEDRFLAALRRYFARFAWRNTEVQDLINELERELGRDLKPWATGWLYTAGTSTVQVDSDDEDGVCRRVRLRQRPPAAAPLPHRLDVGVYDGEPEGRLRLRRFETVRFSTAEVDLVGLEGEPTARLLLPNDNDLTFTKIRLDRRSAEVLRSPWRLPTTLSRSVAVHALYGMMVDGELSSSVVTDAIVGCIATEPEPAMVWQLITFAHGAAAVWTPPEARFAEMAKVARGCLAGLESETAPARRGVLADGLALTATTGSQVDAVFRLFTAEGTGQALRWSCLQRLVATDLVTDTVLEREASRDPDPNARDTAEFARTARNTAAAKETGLELMFGERPLSAAQRRRLASAYWQPQQWELLNAYAEAYVDRFTAADGVSETTLHALALDFPLVIATEEVIARTTEVTHDDGLPLRVRNRLLDKVDTLLRAQRAFTAYTPE